MWFLPLILIGAFAVAAASRSARANAPAARQLAAPGVSGSISMLGEHLRVGQVPPPTVILSAIAEAEALGRRDLASDIVQAFVAPVVQQHKLRGHSASYERGSCAIARSPRSSADASCPRGQVLETTIVPPPATAADATPAEASAIAPSATDDDLTAMLNADPRRFMEMVSRNGGFPTSADVQPPIVVPSPNVDAPIAVQPEASPSQGVSQQSPLPGSPIPGINDDAWCEFIQRLSREAPDFQSSRHVGQYRQRRGRLAELGIDPTSIAGSPLAQRSALDIDLADAHHHAAAGGIFGHLGRPLSIPGRDGLERITLSGVLGVIQSAGLEGAVGWLERSGDRKRYPHTTQAFLRTNGVF